MTYPSEVLHCIAGEERPSIAGEFFDKKDPTTGRTLGRVARGAAADAARCVELAVGHYDAWSRTPVVARGELMRAATQLMQQRKEEIAQIVALETGKSRKDARGEVDAAVEMGFFIAGEGRRYYGRTTTSAMPHRSAMIVRQSIGPSALIIAANTPIANVCWKVFPALLCGNTAILKASEDTPYTASWFARILHEIGLPKGVFSLLHGYGEEVGAPLVEDARVRLVSFTGSVGVGRYIQRTAGGRLAKVCLELGGKNPMLVCDDADLDAAAQAAQLSAFSNAGQRCAAGSRILVFSSVYDAFRKRLLEKTANLKVGPTDADDLGPVINEAQLENILGVLERGRALGQFRVLCGGERLRDPAHAGGYYLAPTVVEDAAPDQEISRSELFGPVTCIYRVNDFEHGLALANDCAFGLTAAIFTRSIHRAEAFRERIRAGVVSINGPTYGSEPHIPFGGLNDSGNGFREAGTEVLDVYSDWKSVYVKHDPTQL